jgi:hypothetical protein
MTTNLVQQVSKPTDLEQLREITKGVIGKKCWRANLSYGDELSLHIGARLPYSQKSMTGKEKGAWILGTRGTAWKVEYLSETLVTSEDELETIRQKIHAIEDNIITSLETSYPELGLIVMFGNGYKLRLFPSAEEDFDLPHWELFTPYRTVLKVSPGAMWCNTNLLKTHKVD